MNEHNIATTTKLQSCAGEDGGGCDLEESPGCEDFCEWQQTASSNRSLVAKTTLFRCGQDPRLHRQGCKYVCTTCGGLWGEVMTLMMRENICNVDASSEYVDFIKTDPLMFAQVEGCTNMPELKTHDVEDLDQCFLSPSLRPNIVLVWVLPSW